MLTHGYEDGGRTVQTLPYMNREQPGSIWLILVGPRVSAAHGIVHSHYGCASRLCCLIYSDHSSSVETWLPKVPGNVYTELPVILMVATEKLQNDRD